MKVQILSKNELYGFWCDAKEFVRRHLGKFAILLALQLLAVCLGVRAAFGISDAAAYISSHGENISRYLAGHRNIFAYCCFDLLSALLLSALLLCCRRHFLLAYLTVPILMLRAYIFAMRFCIYIFWLGIGALPYLLLCLLPVFILRTCLYTAIAVWAICRAVERRKYGIACATPQTRLWIAVAILLCAVAVLFGILSYFLTLGIIS